MTDNQQPTQTEKPKSLFYSHQEIADLHRLPIYEIVQLVDGNVIAYGYYHVRVNLAEKQEPEFPKEVRVNVAAYPVDSPKRIIERNIKLSSLNDLEAAVSVLFNKLWLGYSR